MSHGATHQFVTLQETHHADPWLAGSVEPLCLLPAQYYARRDNHGRFEGEFRLLFAVLQDAIRQYFRTCGGNTRQTRQEFWEVKRWFDDSSHAGLFAFENVAELLGIDSGALRDCLERASREMRRVKFRQVWLPRRAVARPLAVGRKRWPTSHGTKKAPLAASGRIAEKRGRDCRLGGGRHAQRVAWGAPFATLFMLG